MDIKEQKRKKKDDRKYYLSDTPIIRLFRDHKNFDNFNDVERYLTKHWPNIFHILNISFGNSLYGCVGEDYFSIRMKSDMDLLTTIEQIKTFDFSSDLSCSVWINRLERAKEFEERQNLIKKYQVMKTEELLMHRRHDGPGGFFVDDWTRQVLKAVLDSREHVPTAEDKKRIRIEKAKLQKTY